MNMQDFYYHSQDTSTLLTTMDSFLSIFGIGGLGVKRWLEGACNGCGVKNIAIKNWSPKSFAKW